MDIRSSTSRLSIGTERPFPAHSDCSRSEYSHAATSLETNEQVTIGVNGFSIGLMACSDACVIPGDSNTFCWELMAEDCLDHDYEWARNYCPLLERTCQPQSPQSAQRVLPRFPPVSQRRKAETIEGPVATNVVGIDESINIDDEEDSDEEDPDGEEPESDESGVGEVGCEDDRDSCIRPTQRRGGGHTILCPPDEPNCCENLPDFTICMES